MGLAARAGQVLATAVVAGTGGAAFELPESFDPDKPALVRHSLSEHPLLQLPALLKLAEELPSQSVRHYRGRDVDVRESFEGVQERHSNRLTLEESIRNIEENGAYVYLGHIEQAPAYRQLVDSLLGELQPPLGERGRGMHQRMGWIFISSPHSVTPYHRDHETNFLLQVRGRKLVHVWDPYDPAVVSQREDEVFHGNYSLAETRFREELQPKAHVLELTPGLGAYMPFTAPHWVQNGEVASVSLSITYLTEETRRREQVHKANHLLRRVGLRPRPYGASAAGDALKRRLYAAYARARDLRRG